MYGIRRYTNLGMLVAALAVLDLPGQALGQHSHFDARAFHADPRAADQPIAPMLTGLGPVRFPVTSRSDHARHFFEQGIQLVYGFNHPEALRAFKEAARLDPGMAMAYWGWALALGPNINLPMQDEGAAQAYEAIQTAVSLRDGVSAKERDFIDALARRYGNDPEADRASYDEAYAQSMRRLAQKYPDDANAATLYAAALMDLAPWDYWTEDGRPKPYTGEILAALERAMEIDPKHIGALHYYVHAVEAVDPFRGEAAADALRELAPAIGHILHMPSHVYMQLGRYADSFEINQLAAEADEGYIAQCRAQGIYPINYYPHNVHFLAWAAVMLGNSQEALAASRKVASKVPDDDDADAWALFQTFSSMPVVTMVRFGQWQDILREPAPPAEKLYALGVWHFARGLAYVHTGDGSRAASELKALRNMTQNSTLPEVYVGFSHAKQNLTLAAEVLAGEIAAAEGQYAAAVRHLDRAVRIEDGMAYNEPPDWFTSVRHTLGAILLEAGEPEEAEVVYRQDLKRWRDNGYSLFGLWKSLEEQGRHEEAADVEERFRRAWNRADVQLTSSRF